MGGFELVISGKDFRNSKQGEIKRDGRGS